MSLLNLIKGKFLDMIASYTSTVRWSSLFLYSLAFWVKFFIQFISVIILGRFRAWTGGKIFLLYFYKNRKLLLSRILLVVEPLKGEKKVHSEPLITHHLTTCVAYIR